MKHVIKALLAAAILASPSALAALDKDQFKAIKDTDSVVLDPKQSYVIVQTNSDSGMFSFPMTFLRVPGPAELEDYIVRRKAALEKAHAKWIKKHASWEKQNASWEKASKETRKSMKKPVEPVEPTDTNLAFTPIDIENLVTIGPFNRFSKRDDRSTFLHSVQPGRYVYYANVDIANPAFGVCMCMGSFAFDVEPGQIVNIGMMMVNFFEMRQKAKAEGKPMPKDDGDYPEGVNVLSWEVPKEGATIDPRLANYRITPAKLQASGRYPNYLGLQIDRMSAIPGILEYDRDKIVDPAKR
jgi:hypothetical protein